MIIKAKPQDQGCWFDFYIGYAVIHEAIARGWRPSPLELSVTYEKTESVFGAHIDIAEIPEEVLMDHDLYHEIQDEAETWLNQEVAPDGYYFGYSEGGNFGLWRLRCDHCNGMGKIYTMEAEHECGTCFCTGYQTGLCPVCGEQVSLVGECGPEFEDRVVGSCGHNLTRKEWIES